MILVQPAPSAEQDIHHITHATLEILLGNKDSSKDCSITLIISSKVRHHLTVKTLKNQCTTNTEPLVKQTKMLLHQTDASHTSSSSSEST